MREINRLFIHCSATANFKPVPAADIHDWHQDRGWDGIGYTGVIQPNGDFERGRPDYWVPSQAAGNNHDAVGICLIGTDDFTPEAMETLRALVVDYKDRYGVSVHGHNEVNPYKTCPGFDVQLQLRLWGLSNA
ncbi:MAG: N-acetylmuramoyl-L-alanine amidase [Amphritea sp.]|nr:N-acetylmuramoyl-L-alanine amidase [Amphritea sp.]